MLSGETSSWFPPIGCLGWRPRFTRLAPPADDPHASHRRCWSVKVGRARQTARSAGTTGKTASELDCSQPHREWRLCGAAPFIFHLLRRLKPMADARLPHLSRQAERCWSRVGCHHRPGHEVASVALDPIVYYRDRGHTDL